MEVFDIYAVYGDFGNVGNGPLLGIYENEADAQKASIGRGSKDCGGNGEVVKKLCVKIDDRNVYLIETPNTFPLNTVLIEKETFEDDDPLVQVRVKTIMDRFQFMKIAKESCGLNNKQVNSILRAIDKGDQPLPLRKSPAKSEFCNIIKLFDKVAELNMNAI
jgi:hypothetical protein